MRETIGVGLIGYGLAGKAFHAPLIAATPGLRLAAVSTRRAAEAAEHHRDAVVHADPAALIADPAVALVVIASPNDSHAPLAAAALRADKAVVVDKPMATSVPEAEALVALARETGQLFSVFHNRRWDDDFLALSALVKAGTLGDIGLVESRFDRFRPQVQDRWRERAGVATGIWWDLGPHLLDQALQLFGPPETLTADLAIQRRGGDAVDYFNVTLAYDRMRVILSGGSLMADPPPWFSVQGSGGAFVTHGMDGQEAMLRALAQTPKEGRPQPTPPRDARLTNAEGLTAPYRLPPGNWGAYYAALRDALRGDGPNPVTGEEALTVMRGLELAEESSRVGRRLAWR